MYDDDIQSPMGWGYGRSFYKVAKFPTKNISAPVVLVYGGSDSLVDISVMLKELPSHTIAKEIKHYEHLDFLWGEENDKLVIPYVLEALECYSGGAGDESKLLGLLENGAVTNGAVPPPPGYSEDEKVSRRAEKDSDAQLMPPPDTTGDRKSIDKPELVVSTSTPSPGSSSSSDESTGTSQLDPLPMNGRPRHQRTRSSPTSSTAPSSYSSSVASAPMWPAWLSGRTRLGRSPSIASMTSVSSAGSDSMKGTSKPRSLMLGADGVRLGVGKASASSAVSTVHLGEGEELEEEKKKQRRKKAAAMVVVRS